MQKLMERRAQLVTQAKEIHDRLAELDLMISMLRGEESNAMEASPVPPTPRRRKNVKRTVMDLIGKADTVGVTAAEIVDRARILGHNFDRGSISSLLSKFKAAGALSFDGERYYPSSKAPSPELPLRVVN
jgi:hypothetical protein